MSYWYGENRCADAIRLNIAAADDAALLIRHAAGIGTTMPYTVARYLDAVKRCSMNVERWQANTTEPLPFFN